MDDRAFLGRGWSFDVKPDRITGRISMCSGEEDIAQAVRLILNTRKGERAMSPDFGCKLYEFAFESFSQATRSAMVQEIKSALTLHEPRIQDIQVKINDGNSEGCLMINISYVVRATNNPYNMVFPFYLEEGSGEHY